MELKTDVTRSDIPVTLRLESRTSTHSYWAMIGITSNIEASAYLLTWIHTFADRRTLLARSRTSTSDFQLKSPFTSLSVVITGSWEKSPPALS